MNWLLEPRSNYSYDDDESTVDQPACGWKFILFLPLAFIFIFLVSLSPFLALLVYFLRDVYSTLKRTISSGDLCYPFLMKVGVVLAILLAAHFIIHPTGPPIKLSVSLILGAGFILIFTVLPVLALCVYWMRKLIHR